LVVLKVIFHKIRLVIKIFLFLNDEFSILKCQVVSLTILELVTILGYWLGLWCLMPLSTIFQLYHGSQFYWWMKPEYQEKTTDLSILGNKGFRLKSYIKYINKVILDKSSSVELNRLCKMLWYLVVMWIVWVVLWIANFGLYNL
jgi:hypothetical protein